MPISPGYSKHGAYRTNPDKDDIVLSYHDCLLRESDVALLDRNDWLNDVIIGFYFEYLDQQYKKDGKNHLLFIGPAVAQLLKMQDSSQCNTFLDPIEATSYDFVFFPLNDCDSNVSGGSHWSLVIYSRIEEVCYHFDSSSGINSSAAKRFARKIIKYFLDKRDKRYIEMDCPQQNNSYDCGLFVLCLADLISTCILRGLKVSNCDYSVVTEMVSKKRTDLLKLISDLKDASNSA